MPSPVESVIEVLRHKKVPSVPRGELFVGKDFLHRHFPDLSGDYPGQLLAAARRLSLSAIGIDLYADGSRAVFDAGGFGRLEGYFSIGCINGPFSRLIGARGFAGAMMSTRRDPTAFAVIAERQLREMEESVESAKNNGLQAIALADDIAGKKGLLFSPRYFAETILPVYRDMAAMIRGRGLFAFLHSDGDMGDTIGPLIEAGFDCIHPVDAQGGLDLRALTLRFGAEVSFMGHLDLFACDARRIADEV